MTKDFEQITDEAKNLTLTHEEKERVRTALLDYMKKIPVRESLRARLGWQRPIGWTLILPALKNMAVVLVIALLVGAGTSLAAEGTLPGDILYPIKISVNERVAGWFRVDSQSKTEWQAQLLERRLEEAETLAQKGKLNADTRLEVETNFEEHLDRAKKRIEDLENRQDLETAADLSSRLETSLRVHDRILTKLSEKIEIRSELAPIIAKVRATSKTTENMRAAIELKVSVNAGARGKASAEGKQKAAENKIAEVKSFIEKQDSAAAKAEARIGKADEVYAEGKIKLEAKSYGEAFQLFQKSIRIAEEAKLLMAAKKDLDLDIDIDIEEENEVEGDTSTSTETGKDKTDIKIETKGKGEGEVKIEIGL